MHIIETMSGCTGLKINKPFIKTEAITLPPQPYITFHPVHTKGNQRKYKGWTTVVDGLRDSVAQEVSPRYNLIQIGESDNIKYENYGVNVDYLEKTNVNQLAYLIKHSSLHLGYDSLPVHLASHFGVRIVGLWSRWSSHSYPYFSSPKDYIILEPDYDDIGIKPSFGDNDPYDLINTLCPERIIKAVKKILN